MKESTSRMRRAPKIIARARGVKRLFRQSRGVFRVVALPATWTDVAIMLRGPAEPELPRRRIPGSGGSVR